jgi:ribosome-associated protein
LWATNSIRATDSNSNSNNSEEFMTKVEISGEFIELYKLLKFAGLTSSGGEGKSVIADGLVSVNGEVETRKRKKLLAGDVVQFNGQSLCVQRLSQ